MTKREYQPLTLPRITWNKETVTATRGELVAQPLEPGFGTTVGTALRRVLLGGIEGSAVTSVVIKGVNNEFSALPGVIEDTMQVLLNCKEIVIKNKTGKPGSMKLLAKGEAVARVADIVADDHLELLNTEHVLAHVAPVGTLDITFFVECGRGYVPAKWPLGQALQEDGRIYLDAHFSPVRKVTFDVEKTRVGQEIDYDKLLLTIETNGTLTPSEALNYGVSVLRTQLENFLSTPEIPFNELSRRTHEPERPAVLEETVSTSAEHDILNKPIDVFELSVRAHNCLLSAGIRQVRDLVALTEDDLLKIKNFGKKSFDEVMEALATFNLSLGMDLGETRPVHDKDEES